MHDFMIFKSSLNKNMPLSTGKHNALWIINQVTYS